MIVISGALVLVALILLIVGVVGPDLTFVYASIGVSLVSLVFLVIGILQRRGDAGADADAAATPAPEVAQGPADSVTTVLPSQVGTSRRVTEQAPIADSADEEPRAAGDVLVVEGRPRYHVEGCRYLSGKQAELVDVLEARDEGFTPCGVCKPDDVLAAADQDEVFEDEEVVEEDVPGVEVTAPTRTAPRAAKAPAKKTAASRTAAKAPARAAAAAPATPAAAPAAPARKTSAVKAASKTAAVKAPARTAAVKAPSKAAAAAAASTPAAVSAARKPGSVVVIPDRGKFHRAECRFVRDAPEAQVLTKAAATRQGYAACGVCKP